MMKKIFLTLIVAFISLSAICKNRALLIGIGNYPDNSGWQHINSANDINIIKSVLPSSFLVKSLVNQEATHKRIIDAILDLTTSAQPNDTVLIHFSCHGQQIITDKVDEPDMLDEALVPYDAKSIKDKTYTGNHHLLDNELGSLLDSLRKKIGEKGLVIVTLDACYSDSMNKAGEKKNNIVYRGGAEIFGINDVDSILKEQILKNRKNVDTDTVYKLDNASNLIIISACKTYQKNMELVIDGKGYGSLSYCMYESFNEYGFNDPIVWMDSIMAKMHRYAYTQTPQIRNTIGYQYNSTTNTAPPQCPGFPPPTKFFSWQIILLFSLIIILTFACLIIWKRKKK